MTTPTLINLPPPPSDPVTPSDMGPGTPNSGTTSLSALSTTAIKDGHTGQPLPHSRHSHHSPSASTTSTTTLEAERADRISRLAGLERVATARAGGHSHHPSAMSTASHPGYYFEGTPTLKERSTVGSASATGSVGARTTWASGSDAFDADKMSEDPDPDDRASSVGDLSDEGDASLVGFGEGASTISGPTSSAAHLQQQQQQQQLQHQPGLNRMSSSSGRPGSLGGAAFSPAGSITPEPGVQDARMVDGITYDADVVDTTVRTPRLATPASLEDGDRM